jgi:hypothetical protein
VISRSGFEGDRCDLFEGIIPGIARKERGKLRKIPSVRTVVARTRFERVTFRAQNYKAILRPTCSVVYLSGETDTRVKITYRPKGRKEKFYAFVALELDTDEQSTSSYGLVVIAQIHIG